MNDQPVYSPVHDRARAQLEAAADALVVPSPPSPSNVRHLAERRTSRRRGAFTGAAVAACGIGLLAGLLVLESPSTPELEPHDTLGAPAVEPAPNAATTLQPAQLGAPAFVWKVVEPAQGESVTSTFDNGGFSQFPGYGVSTAPGRSNDYDNIEPVIWRTDDGISWEPTDLASPFGTRGIWNSASVAGRLFSVGTAPGIAATDPNLVQVAIADPSTTDWNTVELPYDTNRLHDLEFVHAGLEVANAALDDGILVAVSQNVYVDLPLIAELAQASGLDVDLDRLVSSDDNGVTVLAADCDSDTGAAMAGATATTVLVRPDGAVIETPTSGTEPPAKGTSPTGPCDTVTWSWSELGVPPASVDAIGDSATEFFRVDTNGAVTPIESPVPDARMFMMVAGPSPIFATRPGADDVTADLATYRFEGGAWHPSSAPNVSWAHSPVAIGDQLMGFTYGAAGTQATTVGADGAVTNVDIASLYGPNSLVNVERSTSAGDRLVSAVQRNPDLIAQAGGVEYSRDGVTVRQDSSTTEKMFLDTASGQRIDASLISNDDDNGDVVIVDADGTERIRLTQDELYTNLEGSLGELRGQPEWSIATTADGVTFTVESIADLLGVDPSAINYVPRVSSDGTQVVVAVSLNDRWPDESRKQVLLVGTPTG